jgi:hypothetical protein
MNRHDRRARVSNKPSNYKTKPLAKNRQLEAELRSAAHGRMVLMECATCPAQIPQGHFSVSVEGSDLGRGTATAYAPLQWESKVLAMDASGPVLSEPFCPSCTRRGRRAWVTEQDGTGLNEAEIMAIGQERIITLCFLLTQMMNPDDYRETAQMYPLLTVSFIAHHSCQLESEVVSHLIALGNAGWIDAPRAGKGERESPQYKFAFGTMWKQFFERINAKKEKQITEAPKMVLAIDCGHESPFQVMGLDGLKFLDAELLAEFREQIATGEIELHRPLLCAECDAKEKARNG